MCDVESGLNQAIKSSSTCSACFITYLPATELTISSDDPASPYLETFPSLFPYSQAITVLDLYGYLCSDDRGVPVLQQLSHYCPRLRELALPTPDPPYLSLVPQLPQHTLDTLTLRLPFTKDDSVLVPHLQQCLALKHLILWGAEDKLVMMIHSLWYPHSTLIFLYCWFQASLNSVQFSVVT